MKDPYARVAVAAPLDEPLTYEVPETLDGEALRGARVLVPLGRRKVTGYILEREAAAPAGVETKAIEEVLDPEPILTEDLLHLAAWTAAYYFAPVGEVLRAMLPAGINVASEAVLVPGEREERIAFGREPELTPAERVIVNAVARARELPVRALAKATGRKVGMATLYALRRKGFVDLVPRVGRARTVHKVETFVAIPAEVYANLAERALALERRAPKQARLLRTLASLPLPTTASELRAQMPDYATPLRELVRRGLATTRRAPVDRGFEAGPGALLERRPEPTDEQAAALDAIGAAIEGRSFAPFLLHGVTGSGKTEVYLRAIERALEVGRTAMALVPEIALTPQLIARFRARFGTRCAVLHSGLSERERFDHWWAIRRGRVRVALGVRSAVFAPLADLGVLVVDEEHETSYKQDSGVRYHARDLALVRGERAGAAVILGSATPSLESYRNAVTGKYRLFELRRRVAGRPLPPVIVTNPAHERGSGAIFGKALEERLGTCLAAGHQAILFLNRRGFAPSLVCHGCGRALRCPNCSVALTYHAHTDGLQCHYCEFRRDRPGLCDGCGEAKLHPLGLGTEKVVAEVERLFPAARVARMDRDATAKAGAFERLYHDFLARKIDVLVGTQMVVKGHHFPHVTLVGVVMADQSLHFPDFRAGERTFQLLTQVAGRAGRGDAPGEVVVQSYAPHHYAIQAAREHDYTRFYEREIAERRELGYPPFMRAVTLRVSGRDEGRVRDAVGRLARAADTWIAEHARGAMDLLGPAPAPLVKLQGRFRYHLFLKSPSARRLHEAVVAIRRDEPLPSTLALDIDVDPQGAL